MIRLLLECNITAVNYLLRGLSYSNREDRLLKRNIKKDVVIVRSMVIAEIIGRSLSKIPEIINTLSNGLLWMADQSVHFSAQQKWLQSSYQFSSSWGATITSLFFLFSILILYKLIKKRLWAGGIPFLVLGLGLKFFGTVG